jgi:hypothetical protein
MMPHALQVKVKAIFYGGDRPIHVSYGPEQKGGYIDLVMTETGAVGSEKT